MRVFIFSDDCYPLRFRKVREGCHRESCLACKTLSRRTLLICAIAILELEYVESPLQKYEKLLER
ncbi:MAG: hypothetical protein PUD74_03930 [Bacteroidales bacterium]|nr:hypothetical protein [Bacteroidales bacterium]